MNQLNVRNVDEALWREFRARATRRGVSAGDLLNEALRDWLGGDLSAAARPPDAAERTGRIRGMWKDRRPRGGWDDELDRMRLEELLDEARGFMVEPD
jgi:plasmid stability protein